MSLVFRILALLTVSVGIFASSSGAQELQERDDRASQLKRSDIAGLKPDNEIFRLPWDTIMERDILWKKRVWRDVDAAIEVNAPFAPGAKSLAAILLRGALGHRFDAYADNDGKLINKVDSQTLAQMDVSGNRDDIAKVTKYIVKEDWFYVESKKKLVVRIVGIAPVAKVAHAGGGEAEQALFWVYYPAAREYLSGSRATATANWDQLLQSRNFGSEITRVSEPTRPDESDIAH
ncbi:MAG: hypothetical protein KF744_04550 [Taibaiella sp.]|nr:hypothetical protein [Taibaiella sp.]